LPTPRRSRSNYQDCISPHCLFLALVSLRRRRQGQTERGHRNGQADGNPRAGRASHESSPRRWMVRQSDPILSRSKTEGNRELNARPRPHAASAACVCADPGDSGNNARWMRGRGATADYHEAPTCAPVATQQRCRADRPASPASPDHGAFLLARSQSDSTGPRGRLIRPPRRRRALRSGPSRAMLPGVRNVPGRFASRTGPAPVHSFCSVRASLTIFR